MDIYLDFAASAFSKT